jgi:hypothetical protein
MKISVCKWKSILVIGKETLYSRINYFSTVRLMCTLQIIYLQLQLGKDHQNADEMKIFSSTKNAKWKR